MGFYGSKDARLMASLPAFAEKMKVAGKRFEHHVYEWGRARLSQRRAPGVRPPRHARLVRPDPLVLRVRRLARVPKKRAATRHPGERLELVWPGKTEARREAARPSRCALRPMPKSSVQWDETGNLVIEGDAIDALKLLAPTHAGQVKLIYIDPPYNTGNDGIYEDDFGTHARWLSMIHPRLALAKPLLREDGVVFVSIDGRASSTPPGRDGRDLRR